MDSGFRGQLCLLVSQRDLSYSMKQYYVDQAFTLKTSLAYVSDNNVT